MYVTQPCLKACTAEVYLLQEARACEAELKQKAAVSLNLKLPTLLKGSPEAAIDASELQPSPFQRYNPPSPEYSPVSPPYSPHSPGWRTWCGLLGHPLLARCAAAQQQMCPVFLQR